MKFSIRTLFTATLCIAAFSQLSCKVNDYCLECLRGDGGHDGGGTDDGGDGGTGMDGSGSGSACIQTNGGVEICDGKDNDCNGLIDDGTLPEVGDACANQVGECMGGTKVCSTKFHCSVTTTSNCNGPADTTSCPGTETCVAEGVTTDHIACTKNPTPERCDGKDNDCNGSTDEGDPGGGSKCGTDLGECVAGTNHCVNGSVQCQGFIDHTMDPELCDGKDNDCDGNFDEGLTNMGTCGQSNTAPCHFGTLSCGPGGAPVCNMAQDPTFEACDGIDNDCNGVIDDGYNKTSDPNTCGQFCTTCTVPASYNANPTCNSGTCSYACKPGYKDADGNPNNGCEFGPCFPTGNEVCDGKDNDCDGNVDESLTPPGICLTKGECAGTVASCTGAGGWVCNYNSNVETSGGQVVAQETRCDELDNDCDGATDESFPLKKTVCHDNQVGICETFGKYKCDTSNITGPVVCDNAQPGQTAVPEACDNVDNDCDGNVDEDLNQQHLSDPAVVGEDWINIGGGQQMTKFEMSKPDASSTDSGTITAHACSQQTVQPWVNVTYPQAVAACSAIGATLCGETEWHRACSVINPPTYPITANIAGTLIEAEDYSSLASATDAQPETTCTGSVDEDGDGFINDGCPIRSGTAENNATGQCANALDDDGDGRVNDGCPAKGSTRSWVEDQTPGFSGISDIAAIVNAGVTVPIASATTQSPRVDYQVTFNATGNWHVWVKMFAPTTNDDTLYAVVNTGAAGSVTPNVTMTVGTLGAWTWVDSGAINIPAIGTRTVSLFMGKDGVRVDQLWISQSGSPPNTINGKGQTWSYATTATTYQPAVCNGQDFSAANDNTIATGTATSCYANDQLLTGGTANDQGFDMSGNVKEWVKAEQPGHNPIRGGSSNNTGPGIACALNFTLADDTFFFSNVGFRCCRAAPPP